MSTFPSPNRARRGWAPAALAALFLFLLTALRPAPAVAAYYAPTGPTEIISAGAFHTCALRPVGDIFCWGDNTFGQAADQGPGPYMQSSAGVYHTCALTPAGAADCWGDNSAGQATDKPGPYTQVSAGLYHTCALKLNGAVDCWGYSNAGQAADKPGPYTLVGAGAYHTCALTVSGAADCWGENDGSQAADQPGPYTQITAGDYYNCGLTPAGAADCWGYNGEGQADDQPGPFEPYVPPTADLTIVKQVTGIGAGYVWSFAFSSDLGPFTLNKDEFLIAFDGLAPGDYTVTEAAVPGYATSVACDNGDSSPDGSLTVTMAGDDDVICVFANDAQPGRITITKRVQGIPAPWSFEVGGELGQFFLTDFDPSMIFDNLEAGAYTINEVAENGVGVGVSCNSGEAGVAVVTVLLVPDENVTCTLTNTTDPAKVTIIKQVTGVGPAYNWSFDFDGELGPFTLDKAGPQVVFESVAPGDYAITETAIPGYETSAQCTNGNSSPDGSLSLTLDPNEEVVCTFTNAADPDRITVVKQTVGIDPPWSFAFTGDLGAFTLSNGQPSRTFSGLAAGEYAVNETTSPGGEVVVLCDSGDSGAAGITVALDPGEGVICTFINTLGMTNYRIFLPYIRR